ncbi:hypothetical protein D3C81_1590120 [compost metagenome]
MWGKGADRRNAPADLAASQVLDHRRLALVGDMGHVEPFGLAHVGPDQMGKTADRIGAITDLALVLRCPGEELLNVFRRYVLTDGEHVWPGRQLRHERQIAAYVIRHLGVE